MGDLVMPDIPGCEECRYNDDIQCGIHLNFGV